MKLGKDTNIHRTRPLTPWLLRVWRSFFLLAFQALLAIGLVAFGSPGAWKEASRWWIFAVIAANIASFLLHVQPGQAEGKPLRVMLRFSHATRKKDLFWFIGSSVIGLPLTAAPMGNLAVLLFGDSMSPINRMFQPFPAWSLIVGVLFPLTIAVSELPTNFGDVMPRLAAQLKSGWAAWLLASLFLAAQHIILPFIPDVRIILWRFGMVLPFALFSGLLLKFRPQWLPCFVIVSALMDFSTLSDYLML